METIAADRGPTIVASAVWESADAVMLSGETASGKYPLLAVQMVDRIVREADVGLLRREVGVRAIAPTSEPGPMNEVIAAAACEAATVSRSVAICCFTLRGETARLLAHFRPDVPIVAFSPDQSSRRRLAAGHLPRRPSSTRRHA